MGKTVADQVIVVTGAASGLGLTTARILSAQGARLVLVDVDIAALETAASSFPGECLSITADIADAAQIGAAVDQAANHFGRIDVVMACAAIVGWGPFLETDPALWDRAVEVNVLGTARTIRAALPHLLRSKGYVLVVSSGFAAAPGPAASAYALSKAAVESLARSLRIEVAHHGVDVGVAYYSFLSTPMVEAFDQNPAATRARKAMPAPIRRTFPVEKAAAATADGIARRADRVLYPSFLRWPLALRGLMGRRSEGASRRAMPEVEALARQQRIGAGGN